MLARRHRRGHVRRSDARGKGSHGPVGTGMRVGPDDEHPGAREPQFRKKRMLHADPSDIVKMHDAEFPGEFPEYLDLLGRFDVLVRGEMVGDERDSFGS